MKKIVFTLLLLAYGLTVVSEGGGGEIPRELDWVTYECTWPGGPCT